MAGHNCALVSGSYLMALKGRKELYGTDIQSNVRFTRLDTDKSVEVNYMPKKVVNTGDIMQSAFGPDATEESKKDFPKLWQEMVKTIFDNADLVIEVK